MTTYITKIIGQKESISLDITLDQARIYGLYLLDDPTHMRTIRTPAENCICAFNYISRIVSIVQRDTAFMICEAKEEKIK